MRTKAKMAGDVETLARLDAAPKLTPSLLLYWQAFHDLDSERQPSMSGVGRISRSKVLSYALYECGLDEDESYALWKIISEADAEWRKELNSRNK